MISGDLPGKEKEGKENKGNTKEGVSDIGEKEET